MRIYENKIKSFNCVASIASFATPAGCLFGAYMMDHFGRKFALIFLSIPCILGWLMVGTTGFLAGHISNNNALNIIYCGRMLKGFGVGIVAGASRIYTSEVHKFKNLMHFK
jgi:MFS family permease